MDPGCQAPCENWFDKSHFHCSKSANAKTYGGRKRTATENKADDDRDDPNENQRELRRSTRIVAKATANDIKPQRKKQLKPVKLQLSEHYSIVSCALCHKPFTEIGEKIRKGCLCVFRVSV